MKEFNEINWETRYAKAKKRLFDDPTICKENKTLFDNFFKFEEYKLKRSNNLRALDSNCFKTLYGYIVKLRRVNLWFNNKPFEKLTESEIKKVYDDLEDGKIKRVDGKPYENLYDSYYCKIFLSKPFELAGKLDITKNIFTYPKRNDKEVRFITEQDFKKIVNHCYKPHHKLLAWLAWDIGENINSLLKLTKNDFTRQENPNTKEPEFIVNLRREILKRSRKPRSEITNYQESVELLDQHLSDLGPHELLFDFGYGNSKKILERAVERAKVKCLPNGEKPTWKDLRSGMACDLLKKGWTTDEVNSRLGHRPSSDEIDKYINFLAIDRHRPKEKVRQYEMEKLNSELEDVKRRERLQTQRNENLAEQLAAIQKQMKEEQKERDMILEIYEFLGKKKRK